MRAKLYFKKKKKKKEERKKGRKRNREKKKRSLGMNGRTFSPNPRKGGKSHHHHHQQQQQQQQQQRKVSKLKTRTLTENSPLILYRFDKASSFLSAPNNPARLTQTHITQGQTAKMARYATDCLTLGGRLYIHFS